MTVIYNDELKKKFIQFIQDNKVVSMAKLSMECKGTPSAATFSDWKNYGRVSEMTVRQFLRHFPNLDPDDWLGYFDKAA